jgi:hypothetical protein
MARVDPLLDPNDQPAPVQGNRGTDQPTASTPGERVPQAPSFNAGDISSMYRGILGRDPDQTELASELENAGRYGLGQLQNNLQERRGNITTHRPFDSQSGDPAQQAANRQADAMPFMAPSMNPRGMLGSGPLNIFGGMSGVTMPDNIFDDPTSRLMEDLIRGRIGQLNHPVNDPSRGQYQGALQGAFDRLSGPQQQTPVPGGGQTSQEQYRQALQQQIARFMNPSGDENALMQAMRAQFGELSQTPGYSPDERALLNTQTFEPIEALRRASQERERERTSQAGYLPTSGVHNARMTNSDRYFDQMRTTANRDLAVQEIDRRDADQARALTVGTGLANRPIEMGNNALLTSGTLQDFDQGQADRGDARAGQAATVAGLLAALSQGARTEDDARQGQAIQLAQTLRQMPMQSLQQAMAVLNGTAPPESLLPAMMQLAQSGQAQNQQFYQTLGYLASLFD